MRHFLLLLLGLTFDPLPPHLTAFLDPLLEGPPLRSEDIQAADASSLGPELPTDPFLLLELLPLSLLLRLRVPLSRTSRPGPLLGLSAPPTAAAACTTTGAGWAAGGGDSAEGMRLLPDLLRLSERSRPNPCGCCCWGILVRMGAGTRAALPGLRGDGTTPGLPEGVGL